MKSVSPAQNFSLTSLYCSTFGHSFTISNKITNHINEYKCKTCGQEVTNVASGDIELLTYKNKKVNASLSAFLKKNHNTTLHCLTLHDMKSIRCKVIGHRYIKKSKSSVYVNDYECKNCHQKFTTDGYGTIIKLTSFWKENNSMFKNYIQKNKV